MKNKILEFLETDEGRRLVKMHWPPSHPEAKKMWDDRIEGFLIQRDLGERVHFRWWGSDLTLSLLNSKMIFFSR